MMLLRLFEYVQWAVLISALVVLTVSPLFLAIGKEVGKEVGKEKDQL